MRRSAFARLALSSVADVRNSQAVEKLVAGMKAGEFPPASRP